MGTWTKEDFADFKPDLPDSTDDSKESTDPDMSKEDVTVDDALSSPDKH